MWSFLDCWLFNVYFYATVSFKIPKKVLLLLPKIKTEIINNLKGTKTKSIMQWHSLHTQMK